MMEAAIRRLLAKPAAFPIEISLSSGDRLTVRHPELLGFHRVTKDLIFRLPDQVFTLAVNPQHIVSIKPLGSEA
jgi:hypothetical protein